ncbi:hypothetical protein E8E13_003077 [Curvularia kusanoi]|uniref:NACHT domain-containing protein n=1 Tax=Curvularia kusanoi TaxID=90978 RepID=A0A9P4T4F4_CURKU|nr:hypothetical protein E8E13_003077 [Curvularia kusanoi]
MEGLAAVSLAGNILQFVHTTRQLLRTSREILASGTKAGHVELEAIATELRSRADSISLPQLPDVHAESQGKPTLEALALQCKHTADELLAILATLRLSEEKTKWTSFVQALRTQWHDSEIEALRDRLKFIGQAVDASILDNRTSGLQAQLNRLLENSERLEISRTEDIVRLKEYFSQALKDHQDKEKEKNEGLWADQVSRVASEGVPLSAEQAILSRLRFVRFEDRSLQISSAHEKTLTWLFGSHSNRIEHSSSTTFVEWLKSDDSLYWVTGRPGSGKSTLMKFLGSHQSTKEQLKVWAEDDGVVIAEYFFWDAGKNELQKSQEGLLRSLLYQILRQYPDQIRLVFPGAWRLYNSDHPPHRDGVDLLLEFDIPSTISGLIDALARTCQGLIKCHKRFCFFIDGLDEYNGDTNDIIQLVNKLRNLEHVKICVSSRQWNEFEEAFGKNGTTKLLMENFNHRDINAYIDDVFANDENFQDREDKETRGKALVDEIVAAANGVFLWVVLVVRSFQEGMREGDSIKRLQDRLRHLPKSLEEYFERILFHDVKETYRDQAAVMFLVTLVAKENLPLMAYWFLDEDDCPTERRPLTGKQTIKRHKDAKKRLIAGCKGLLEPHFLQEKNSQHLSSSMLFEYRVDFLHRTVRDYLKLPTTNIRSWVRPDFEPNEAICKAVFSQIKTSPQEPEYGPHVSGLYEIFNYHIDAVSGSSKTRMLEKELSEMMVSYGVATAAVTSNESLHEEVSANEIKAGGSSECSLENKAMLAEDLKPDERLPRKKEPKVKNLLWKIVGGKPKTASQQ